MCYIETKNLDGESNLKYKQANAAIAKNFLKEEDFAKITGLIECTQPNEIINDFSARYYEDPLDNTKFINIDKQSLLLKGCSLKQTACVYGIAVYLGKNTKMLKNYPVFNYKQASIISRISNYIYFLI